MRGFPSSMPSYGNWIVLASAVLVVLGWMLLARRRTPSRRDAVPSSGSAGAAPSPGGPWEDAAARAVQRAGRRLVGQRYAGLTISSVLHYGAVDLDTRHLVVWILVSGARSEELPGWWSPEADSQHALPSGWAGWLTSVRDEVRGELQRESWPDAASATVLVDSHERVSRVGFDYFR